MAFENTGHFVPEELGEKLPPIIAGFISSYQCPSVPICGKPLHFLVAQKNRPAAKSAGFDQAQVDLVVKRGKERGAAA